MSTFHSALRLALLLCIWMHDVHARWPMSNKQIPRYFNASTSLPVASGSCGMCGIEAPGGVQLIYWQPDATNNQSSVTAINDEVYTHVENGFTFTSPSVYVVYSSLRATVTCGSSMLETTGPFFEAKTIAYSSRFLAYGTLEIPGPRCDEYVVAGGFHTIDFQDLYTNPITTTTLSKPGCPPYVNPRLSLPADLTTVDPSWASCEPLFYGAFDPPRFLKKASGGMLPSAAAEPTVTAAGGVTVSDSPAVAQAIPAPVTPVPTATTDHSPSDPLPKAASPAQNAGSLGPIQPSQALHASPNTPANAAETTSTNLRQSTPGTLVADTWSPDQLSQLHQVLQSTTPADPARGDVGAPVVSLGESSALAIPILAPGSPTTSTRQNPQESDVNPNIGPDTQNVPHSVPGQMTNAAFPLATQTHMGPIPLLVDPGDRAAKEGSPQISTTLGDVGPVPASTRSMGETQSDPSPVLVPPGNGALLEFSSNNPPTPAGAEAGPSITGTQETPMPIFVDPGNGAFVEGSSSNGAATPAGVVYDAQGLETSQSRAAAHPIKVNSPPVNGGYFDKAGDSRPVEAGNSDGIGDGATNTGGPGEHQAPIPLVIGGNTVSKAPDGALLIAGQSFTPGSQATVSGAIVSVGSNNVVVDDTTHAFLPTPSGTPASLMVGESPAQRGPSGVLVVATQTIAPGDQATISGAVVSVGNNNVVVDGTTHFYSSIATESLTPLLIEGQTAEKAPDGAFTLGSRTIPQGSHATISGHIVTVGASELVVDASTLSMSPNMAGSNSVETQIPLSVAGYAVQKAPDGGLVIASQTISPGSHATISGIVISAGTNIVVVDRTTHDFWPQFAGTSRPQSLQSIVYMSSNAAITLSSGATFQSGGSVITYIASSTSVLTKPTQVVLGTTTVPYKASETALATAEAPVGGLIASAFGSGAAASTALSKANLESAPERSGNANGSGPALGAGVREKSCILLVNGIFALLGYITFIL